METTCTVCLKNPKDLKLICGHSFCKNCVYEYVKTKILNKEISKSPLVCLEEKCLKPINMSHIKLEDYSKELYENYKKQIYQSYDDDGPSEEVKIEKSSNNIDQNKNNKNLQPDEVDYQNYVKEKDLKKCPVCNAYIEKIGNACNYIQCASNKCCLKTTFCYVCGEKLNNVEDHYKGNNCKKARINNENIVDEKKQNKNDNKIGNYLENSVVLEENSKKENLKKEKNEQVRNENPYCLLI